MIVILLICQCRHHPMVFAIMMAVRWPKWAQTRSPELLRGPFCAAVRAERTYGDKNLPRAPWAL
eukprot:13337356-Alexandrium_andersonii.AAC.1